MYAKIYKEIFIKGYTLKKQIKGNIWIVKVANSDYYLSVYKDEEIVDGFNNYDEAELLQYKKIKNTEKRITENRKFLEIIRETKIKYPYLFKNSSKQISIFNFDTYSLL